MAGMRPDTEPVQLLPHRHGTDGFFIAGFTSE
jgi:16S rRNA C967 or C1407 C5-methylase (RsmB/RsmF family)